MNFTFSSPPDRQPRASDAHPCTPPCARRRASTVQLGSRTGFTLPLVLHQPLHTVQQQPARLMTSHRQQVCAPLLPRRCTGMRSQDNGRHPPCVQPSHGRTHNPRTEVRHSRARGRATAGTASRNERSTGTRTASTWLHRTHRNSARPCHKCAVVFRRLRISTQYSKPITARLSADCKARLTPIPR